MISKGLRGSIKEWRQEQKSRYSPALSCPVWVCVGKPHWLWGNNLPLGQRTRESSQTSPSAHPQLLPISWVPGEGGNGPG